MMVDKKKYTLKKLLNNRGCYASIIFEVFLDSEKESGLVINYNADLKWEISSKAGVLIFYDFFNRTNRGQLTVTIHQIDWMPVDTNNTIVLFATIEGLSELLEFNINNLKMDLDKELFIIPEPRSVMGQTNDLKK